MRLFTRKKKRPVTQVVVDNPWKLEVAGKVTALKKQDIDKSGRGLKNNILGTIKLESKKLEGASFAVAENLDFIGKEKDFQEKLGYIPEVGKKLTITFKGTEEPVGRVWFK